MASQFSIAIALAVSVTARPSNTSTQEGVPESIIDQDSALILDDMRFTEDHLNELKSAMSQLHRRWPLGVVTYTIDPSLIPIKSLIERAMTHIEQLTCIRFTETILPIGNYLNFFLGQGCYTYVGMSGGKQPLSLGNGCHYIGTVVHEILHALGLYHEQSRSDRDDFISIYWENIRPGLENQFQILAPYQELTFGIPYNYYSIMHYGEYAFSKDPTLKTMADKNGRVTLTEPYSKQGMSFTDIQLVRALYNCLPKPNLLYLELNRFRR